MNRSMAGQDHSYPTFEFERIYRSKLDQFTTGVISLYSDDLAGMVDANVAHRHRTKRGIRGWGSRIVRRLGYETS